MAYLTVNGPDNSLQAWARGHALAELAEEDERFAAYAQDSGLQQEMADKFKAMGKHPDRCACDGSKCWHQLLAMGMLWFVDLVFGCRHVQGHGQAHRKF
jgi:hypothetical protein